MVLRLPHVLQGRFWAEEGDVFLLLAWQHPWLAALFQSYGGYLNLTANLGGVLAWHAVVLDDAPFVTMALAFAIQLCPVLLMLGARCDWLSRPSVLAAALACMLLVPGTEEVWLSTIGSQTHLALCAALILAFRPSGPKTAAFRLVLLALGALSGPGSWMTAPLFALKLARDRSGQAAAEAVALCAGIALQLIFFFHPYGAREFSLRPIADLCVIYERFIVQPFGGFQLMDAVGRHLLHAYQANMLPRWPAMAALAAAGIFAIAVWRARVTELRWLLAACVLILAGTLFGALRPFSDMFVAGFSGRYQYVPQVLINLCVLGIAANTRTAAFPLAATALACLMTVGAFAYAHPLTAVAEGPSYARELALHRRDHRHAIAGWPTGWSVRLPDDVAGTY